MIAEMLHVDRAETVPVNRPVVGIEAATAAAAEIADRSSHRTSSTVVAVPAKLARLCATDAGSILGEAVHPVRKPPALQFAVHQGAWRPDK